MSEIVMASELDVFGNDTQGKHHHTWMSPGGPNCIYCGATPAQMQQDLANERTQEVFERLIVVLEKIEAKI